MTKFRWPILFLTIVSLLIAGYSVFQGEVLAGSDIRPSVAGETRPSELSFLQGDVAFLMDQGSYCWFPASTAMCADYMPPSYAEDMHTLVIGPTLELQFDAPYPNSVSVSLHPGSNLTTRIADIMTDATIDENGRVLVTVPDDLDGDYVLSVFATWPEDQRPHGDASYFAPIRFEG